ncbi:hypothetical protein [Microbispora sp. ATCC PTA-5024]|uniref:hypothetical protein n=1 Tax=Microbispora sp. ATCC PTA-5024 TaxID=316330 RepID=UPI0012ED1828|nr:hypothetical protein [Microbispora sp. ATCC PTA-5024]
MSKRVILTLASAAVLSALVPGVAGYATAQFQALDQARKELARLQAQLQMMELTVEPAAAVPCGPSGRGHSGTETALDDDRELTIPPRTHTRPWNNATSGRVLTPTLFTSLSVPNTISGPEPGAPRRLN